MTCRPKVSTGQMSGINTGSTLGGTPRSTWNVLFNPATSRVDDPYSDAVTISPGKGALVVVYALGEGEEIYTNMVAMGSGFIGGSDPCSHGATAPVPVRGQLIDMARVTLGDPDEWVFRNDPAGQGVKTQMIINIPGRYQFELQNEMMASRIYMEYCLFDLNLVPNIPWPYLGGISS